MEAEKNFLQACRMAKREALKWLWFNWISKNIKENRDQADTL